MIRKEINHIQKLDADSKNAIRSILWFVEITYFVSGAGYSIWFHNVEAAAFLPIIALFIAYLFVKQFLNKQERIAYRKVSVKGILVGMLLPIGYIVGAVFICSLFLPDSIQIKLLDGQTVTVLFVQWIFAGFCEEIGWRGFLLKGKTLVDDGGYLLVALIGALAVIVWVTVKIRKRGLRITSNTYK